MLSPQGPNAVPGHYRGVAVAEPGCPLDTDSLRAHFLGREAYRRTRFIVVRHHADTALIQVAKESAAPLFSRIIAFDVVAGPEDCAFVHEPDADPAIPSALAEVARRHAPGARAVVVQGLYGYVSFIVDPRPLRIRVRDVVPPSPAKLYDQARRVIATAEDLPPIELVPHLIRLSDLARAHPSGHYLLPCHGSGAGITGAEISYLDERPPDQPWTLLGCARSQQIHRWFYQRDPPTVDICPLRWNDVPDGTDAVLLTRCCQQEEDIEHGDQWASVPWGSSLAQVRAALCGLARQREPSWAPV